MQLRQALERLRLTDSSLSYEEECVRRDGQGFPLWIPRHAPSEIIVERLKREFNLPLVVTMPTTVYEITLNNGTVEEIYNPAKLPDDGTVKSVREPGGNLIITPPEYIGGISQILLITRQLWARRETLPDGKVGLNSEMPLRELMRTFFDKLKIVSSGFASFSYELLGLRNRGRRPARCPWLPNSSPHLPASSPSAA